MALNLMLCLTVFVSVFLTLTTSAPFIINKEISNKLTFHQANSIYNRFIKSPPPREELLETRQLLQENVSYVEPEGIVVLRCPRQVGISTSKRICKARKTNPIKVQVFLTGRSGNEQYYKEKTVLTYNEVKCKCMVKNDYYDDEDNNEEEDDYS